MRQVISKRQSADVPTELVAKARQFARRSLAESTRRHYRTSFRIFAEWCALNGRVSMPASPETMALFLADIADRYRFGTLKMHVEGIAFAHRSLGEPFDRWRFSAVMQGIRRAHGTARREVAPIMVGELRAMMLALPDTLRGIQDGALLAVGFAGALRSQELVDLDFGRTGHQCQGFVEIDAQGARITLLRSKTDQTGKGLVKWLPRGGNPCPVKALESWLAAASITSGPIFRCMSGGRKVLSMRMWRCTVGRIVKRALYESLLQTGLSEQQARVRASQVSSHSLRAGFVTSAALTGVPSEDIALHVGWSSTRMVYRYVRRTDPVWDNPAELVLNL